MKLETATAQLLAPYFTTPESTVDLVAHKLWREADGGWSTDTSWFLRRGATLPEALEAIRGRWEVYKDTYHPRARVRNLVDANQSGAEFSALLEVDGIPFMEILPVPPPRP